MTSSFRQLLGAELLNEQPSDAMELALLVYRAPQPILCHDAARDPRFTYANLAAQRLWQVPWEQFVGMPSRLSAEPGERATRAEMLARVGTHGFIDDYEGVRISADGTRFLIADTVVWNVSDDSGRVVGQAARIGHWTSLPSH